MKHFGKDSRFGNHERFVKSLEFKQDKRPRWNRKRDKELKADPNWRKAPIVASRDDLSTQATDSSPGPFSSPFYIII